MRDHIDITTPRPISGPMQRVRGEVVVTMAAGQGGARLTGLRQQGSAKAFLPNSHCDRPEVVLLNTAGGLTGGDALDYRIKLGAGARAAAMTQTAERAYRTSGGIARLDTCLHLGARADLHWLPQEMILFEDCDVSRCLTVDMADDARFLFVESVVLGRQARGEDPLRARLTDRRVIRRGGVPTMIEAQALDPAVLAQRSAPQLLGQARAMATLGLFAPDATARLDGLRHRLGQVSGADSDVLAAASAWDGRLVARFLAPDGFSLRRALVPMVEFLTGAPVPRVWQA
ncbi:MAG: urease accessory protein UreD [Paracoccaceae bacterium]